MEDADSDLVGLAGRTADNGEGVGAGNPDASGVRIFCWPWATAGAVWFDTVGVGVGLE